MLDDSSLAPGTDLGYPTPSARPPLPFDQRSVELQRPQFQQPDPSTKPPSSTSVMDSITQWGDGDTISPAGAEANPAAAAATPLPPSTATAAIPAHATAQSSTAAGNRYIEAAILAAGGGPPEMYPPRLPGAEDLIREVFLSGPSGKRIKQQVHPQEYAVAPPNTVRYTLGGNPILPSGVVIRPADGGYDDDDIMRQERLAVHQRDRSDLIEVMLTASQVTEDMLQEELAAKRAAAVVAANAANAANAAGGTGGDGPSTGLGPNHAVPTMPLPPSPTTAAPLVQAQGKDKGKLPASCRSDKTVEQPQHQHSPGREAEVGVEPPGPTGTPPATGQDGAGSAIGPPRALRLKVKPGYTPLVRPATGTGGAVVVACADVNMAAGSGLSGSSDGQQESLNLRGAAPGSSGGGGGGDASQMLSRNNLQQLSKEPVQTEIWAVYNEMITATLDPTGEVKPGAAVPTKTAARDKDESMAQRPASQTSHEVARSDSDVSGGGSATTSRSSAGNVPGANSAVAVGGAQSPGSTLTTLIPPKPTVSEHSGPPRSQSRDSEVSDVLLTQPPAKKLYSFFPPTDMVRPADEVKIDPHYVNMAWYQGKMTLPESEAVLRLCVPGTFLVRQSGSRRGELSISTRGADSVCHFRIRYSNLHYSITQFRSFTTLQELVHFYQELNVEFKHPFSLESPGMPHQSEEVERWPQQPLRGREQPVQQAQPRNTFNNRCFAGHDHACNPRGVGTPGGRHGDRTALLGVDVDYVEEARKQSRGGGSHLKWALDDSRAMYCNCRVTLVAALLLLLVLGGGIYMTVLYFR